MNLSKHFTLAELTASDTAERLGIDNTPSEALIANGYLLANLLEDVRLLLGGKPILISSGYRCAALNRAIGGSLASAHKDFLAADFRCPAFGTPREVAQAIADAGLPFDQLIWEGSWVHISADPRVRQEVLTAEFVGGRARYRPGIG